MGGEVGYYPMLQDDQRGVAPAGYLNAQHARPLQWHTRPPHTDTPPDVLPSTHRASQPNPPQPTYQPPGPTGHPYRPDATVHPSPGSSYPCTPIHQYIHPRPTQHTTYPAVPPPHLQHPDPLRQMSAPSHQPIHRALAALAPMQSLRVGPCEYPVHDPDPNVLPRRHSSPQYAPPRPPARYERGPTRLPEPPHTSHAQPSPPGRTPPHLIDTPSSVHPGPDTRAALPPLGPAHSHRTCSWDMQRMPCYPPAMDHTASPATTATDPSTIATSPSHATSSSGSAFVPCPPPGYAAAPGMHVNSTWHRNPTQDPAAADAGGRKRALLIGCSYPGTPYELKGCCTDIDFMRHLLMKQFGYRPDSIMVLRDAPTRDNPAPVSEREIPTRERILLAMKDLVRDARHGDFLFFHFSGHGAQTPDPTGHERDYKNETICPTDFHRWKGKTGHIEDDVINRILVNPLPEGVRLHALIDSCHSGTCMDLRHIASVDRATQRIEWKDEGECPLGTCKTTRGGFVAQFSACEDGESAADTESLSGTHTGVATFLFIQACELICGRCNTLEERRQKLTYRAVLLEMSKGQQDYEHARRLNAPRRQGQLGTLYNFVKGLLQGRGFDSSYADMSGCVHVNRQTPQLSVSDTQVPWDCTGHIRGGFISMEMQI